MSEQGQMEFEKINVEIKKLDSGESFIGVFTGRSKRDWTDKKTGEAKIIEQFHFTDTKGENPTVYFGDGGFVNAFVSANVKEGDTIKVLKGELEDLGGGRKVNSYELFKAKKPSK